MVKGVIRLDSQLGINTFSEPGVLCRGDIPVINPGSVECGSVPSSSGLALGWQGEHIRVEIVVEGPLALGQHGVPGEDDLGTIAAAGYVFIICRAQVDIHRLPGDERGDS